MIKQSRTLVLAATLAATLILVGGPVPGRSDIPAPAASRVMAPATPVATPAKGLTIRLVEDPEKLPPAFAWIARKGDYFISDGAYEALVAGSPRTLWSTLNFTFPQVAGHIEAFAPNGAKTRLETQIGTANVRIGKKPLEVSLASIKEEGGGLVVRSACRTDDGSRLDIVVRYRFAFAAGRMDVSGEITNAGPKDVDDLSFSLGANARQTYAFSPFNAKSAPALNFRVWQRPDHVLGWRYPGPEGLSGAPLPGRLRPGQSHGEAYSLVAGQDVAEVLTRLYALTRIPTVAVSLEVKNFEASGPAEIFVRDAATGLVLYREFLENASARLKAERLSAAPKRAEGTKPKPRSNETRGTSEAAPAASSTLTFPIPPGWYNVRANLFPAVVEETLPAGAAPSAAASSKPGTGGQAAPASSSPARGASRSGTRSAGHKTWTLEAPPLARLHVSITDRKGRAVPGKVVFIGLAPTPSPYFTPDDPISSGRSFEGFKNSLYPAKDGLSVALPAGTYLAAASRGPEYSIDTRVLEVVGGDRRELAFSIDRMFDTPGLASLDPHMHTQASDGYVTVGERLRSLVAEGVDVAVGADHNFISDYRTELGRLGLAGEIAVVGGYEATARTGSIHLNSYPAAPRPGEPGNGAISVEDETPARLFALARAKNPGSIVQINHPQSEGLGYFLTYHLDPEKAATADAPFDAGFDVMEVMNGAKFDESNRQSVEDWFHLLNRGYPVRAVGSSDAHGIDGGETGYSRTYVLYDGPEAQRLDQTAFFAALKKGRSFVTNGPIVSATARRGLTLGGVFVGRRGGTFGDIVPARKGHLDLDITVTGAPWLDVSEVHVVVDGERRTTIPVKSAAAGKGRGALKYRGTVTVEMARDGWVVLEVVGREPLYPLLQQRSGNGRADDAALPYAITNPIFVDADGDGRSDPVWPDRIAIK